MDITMARVCGDAACAALRAGGCMLPIIAVSGTSEGPEYLRAAGFSAALGKPFTLVALRGLLQAQAAPRSTEAGGEARRAE